MKVSGSATLNASRNEVWEALNDPAVLVRTIPGCQRLEEVGPDAYRMTITAGVASIKGVYTGDVSLSQQQPLDQAALAIGGVALLQERRHPLHDMGNCTHRSNTFGSKAIPAALDLCSGGSNGSCAEPAAGPSIYRARFGPPPAH